MLYVLRPLFRKLDAFRYQRNIEGALALHRRGEVRKDGLTAVSVATHLEIEWRARDLHPWDRPLLSRGEMAAAFVRQSLADTEAAVQRLFEALPQVDVLTLRVLDHASETVIISGSVARADVSNRDERLSIGMRLRYLGLTYHSAGSFFEPLEHDPCPAIPDETGRAFRPGEVLAKGVYRKALYRSDTNGS
jgi:hypothetical protein